MQNGELGMNKHTGKFAYLKGSSYEIGKQQALEYRESTHAKEIFLGNNLIPTKRTLK